MSKREMDIKEIRDGPLSVGDFHCSLEDWRLSRATILSNTTRNQMKKKDKESKPATQNTNLKLTEESFNNETFKIEGIRKFIDDVIIMAVYEVGEEEKAKTESMMSHTPTVNNISGKFELQKNGEGDIKVHASTDKNLDHIAHEDKEQMIIETARDVVRDAISAAMYEVSKENINHLQKLKVHVMSDEGAHSAPLSDAEPELQFDREMKLNNKKTKQQKRMAKKQAKKDAIFQKQQEEIVTHYFKMVDKRYEVQNRRTRKAWEKQLKEEKLKAKREKKEKKLITKEIKKEEKLRAKKEKKEEKSRVKQEKKTEKLRAKEERIEEKMRAKKEKKEEKLGVKQGKTEEMMGAKKAKKEEKLIAKKENKKKKNALTNKAQLKNNEKVKLFIEDADDANRLTEEKVENKKGFSGVLGNLFRCFVRESKVQ